MTKKFTKEQMKVLSKYEKNLESAYYGNWCRNMTSKAISEVHDVILESQGVSVGGRSNCGACILELMQYAGRLYFEQLKIEKEESEEKAKAVPKPAPKRKPAPKKKTQ